MIPNRLTKLTADDILKATPDCEYREGSKATLVGWLKELFLYGGCDKYLQISPGDRIDYRKACDELRKNAKIPRWVNQEFLTDSDLHDYEEKITCKKAAALINKTVKGMVSAK